MSVLHNIYVVHLRQCIYFLSQQKRVDKRDFKIPYKTSPFMLKMQKKDPNTNS